MKRPSLWAVLAAACALLTAPGSAVAGNARPVSSSELDFPAAFTVTPNGNRIVYGERLTGRIRRLNPATGTSTPFFKVPNVATAGEQGLLGLALHPSYPRNTRVWAFVTRTVSGRATNQLLRIRADGTGFTVLRSFPAGGNHNGGRIMFGPDGKLYVVVGENGSPSLAQNLATLAGKMLSRTSAGGRRRRAARCLQRRASATRSGSASIRRRGASGRPENGPACNDEVNLVPRTVPSDNPLPGSPIIGYGSRRR